MTSHPLLIALQFLSRLPLPPLAIASDRQIGRSILYYPIVGIILGTLVVFSALAFQHTSAMLMAAIALTCWVLVTGALHIDGLADTADAWVGGFGSPQKTLDIMKDPVCGPVAVAVVGVLLLIKFAALTVLIEQAAWLSIIATLVLARTAVLALILTTPYVRSNGLGSLLTQHLSRTQVWWVVLATTAVLIILGYWIAVIFAILTVYLLRRMMMQRIQGMTGDTAGATLEITEAVALCALA